MELAELRTRGTDLRRIAAVTAAKVSAMASRTLRQGGGTSLPGLVAIRIDPDVVRGLSSQLAAGSVMVSGTNGKTTTSRMLARILSDSGLMPLRNETGSNLMRGLASSLVQRASISGRLASGEREIGLFEIDEAALPEAVSALAPVALLLLDLYRDQLDRYGEVAAVARVWRKALQSLPEATSIVANADDPLVTEVATAAPGAHVFFGMGAVDDGRRLREHASDVKACPRCGEQIEYSAVFLGHLGHYRCTHCGFVRPFASVWAEDVQLRGIEGSSFLLVTPQGAAPVRLPLPGLYNVYNALGAAATATKLGVGLDVVASSLARVTPAFGRMERLQIDGRETYLALAKNPAGMNEVLRTLTQDNHPLHLLVMLNDNAADGRDVSWIWDADVEMLGGQVQSVVFAGARAEDMALRFKYAGVIDDGHPVWRIERRTEKALRTALEVTPRDCQLFIIPTYTALLDVYAVLVKLGYVKPYWEE